MRQFFSRAKLPQVDRQFVLAQMSRPPFHRIRLERCPRGIDGLHIDVALDSRLVNATILMVKAVLRRDVGQYFWRQPPKALSSDIVAGFQKAYIEHTRMALQLVRNSARPELAQLFQLAVVRLLLVVVDQQFSLLRQELHDARAMPSRDHGSHSLELHDRAVALARNEDSIRFHTLKDVLRVVVRMEDSNLRKLRETVLGMSWPLPRSMLVNPVVQLGGIGSNEDFFQSYPHILRIDQHAVELNRGLLGVFSDWLPEGQAMDTDADAQKSGHRLSAGHSLRGQLEIEREVAKFVGHAELARMIPHEFDNAKGVMALLGGDSDLWPEAGPWEMKGFDLVQQSKVRELMALLNKTELMKGIQASYRLAAVYPMLGIRGGAEWVYDYLVGHSSARELVKRLQVLPGVEDARTAMRLIDEKLQAGDDRGRRHADERMVVRFVGDLVRYRYDLKLAAWLYSGLSSLRLLHDEQKLSMSASNGILHDFRFAKAGEHQAVVGHAVLKADIRGSTAITAEMQARNLNPATYFSRTLYDPITRLLSVFGAEKVFVEGDAVILSLMEYEGGQADQLAVARACGLAQRILGVVESKNTENRSLGLPELGLGIGVAYSNGPPTYLYDEDHKIMISSAINRADRLSSCHAGMREQLSEGGQAQRRVVVAQPISDSDDSGKSDTEGLLHYNVNGIEMGAGAFNQLQVELMLAPIELADGADAGDDLYHVGRYSDMRGNSNWLVVRESPVHLWMGDRLVENGRAARVFYEVVAERELVDRIVERYEEQEF